MDIIIDLTPIIDEINNKKYIPVPYLQAKGYRKSVIEAVFAELESFDFGEFNRGKRGRSNFGIFYPNELCPLSFVFELKQKISKKDLFEF